MKRYHELDSLRGLAALTVMFSHIALVFTSLNDLNYDVSDNSFWLKFTPLHLFWAGHEAVMFFFVLSGFVLTLPFLDKKMQYKPYIIKRVCRIYIPFIVSIMFALLMRSLFISNDVFEGLSGWINTSWDKPLDLVLLVKHLQLVIGFDTTVLNPVIWSLIYEMRISIIFPFIALFLIRFNWRISLGIVGCLSLLYMVLSHVVPYGHTYLATMHYTGFFIIGGVLAKHRNEVVSYLSNKTRGIKMVLLLISLFLYTSRWTMYNFIFEIKPLSELVIASGACLLISLSLSTRKLSKILALKPIKFTGEISYSLYLYHLVVLFTLFHMFNGKLPVFVIISLTIVLAYLVSSMSYYFIEKPSIRLGRNISKKLKHHETKEKMIA